MQPLKMYTAFSKEKIPKFVLLGRSPGGEDIKIAVGEFLKGHGYLRGITGSGKTRTLALILMHLLSMGYRCIMIDPLGATYDLLTHWLAYLSREYYMKGESEFNWFKDKILANIQLWDLSTKEHTLRHNMLEPFAGENLSDVIARMIKFADAIFASESGEGMNLQLERRINFISLLCVFAATETPLKESKAFIYNREFRENLLEQAKQRSSLPEVNEAVEHFLYLDREFGSRMSEHINSLLTGLSPFFESPILRKFLLASENNVDFHDIFTGKSLIVKAPVTDLPSRQILMNYLYTVFFDLSDKRPADCDHLFLASDESALVFNSMMADYITRIRNKKVHLINSHQSLGQLLTPEKIKIAETIESQSLIKMYFRHDYSEAEKIVEQIFAPQGKRPKTIEITSTITKNTSEAAGRGVGETSTHQEGTSAGQSTEESHSHTKTENYSVTDSISLTEGMAKQWSESVAHNLVNTWAFQDAFTYSQSTTQQMQQLKGQGLTFTIGQNKTLMKIDTEMGSLTIGESEGVTETKSQSSGITDSEGSSETRSYGGSKGTSVAQSPGSGGIIIIDSNGTPVIVGGPSYRRNETLQRYSSASQANSRQISKARQTLEGMSHSLSKMANRAETKGHSHGTSMGISEQNSMAMSRQFSESVGLAKQYARSIQKAISNSMAVGKTTSHQQAITESTSRSIQKAVQQGHALADAVARSFGEQIAKNVSDGISHSRQLSLTTTIGFSIALSVKTSLYTIQEERILLSQEIRSLPTRVFYLSTANYQNAAKVITDNCYLLPTNYDKYNFWEILNEFYKKLPQGQKFTLFASKFTAKVKAVVFPELPDDFDFTHLLK